MAASETCSRCGEEVRWGIRDGEDGYHHRLPADHQPIFGRIATAADFAEIERQLDLPREQFVPTQTGWPLLFTIETYTTRAHDIAKIKNKAKREAAEAELDEEYVAAEIPPAEIAAEPIDIGDPRLPAGCKSKLVLARKRGWTAWVTYSRGPRVHGTTGALIEMSDCVVLRARLDGADRGAVASWLTKNGKPSFEFAYTVTIDRANRKMITRPANATELKTWLAPEDEETP